MRLLGLMVLGVALGGIPEPRWAQDSAPPPITAPASPAPTTPQPIVDSARPPSPQNPSVLPSPQNSQTAQDSAMDAPVAHKSRSDTVLVVKHSFNHRQQIIAGSVIMTCLMLMMVTMNNYNPR